MLSKAEEEFAETCLFLREMTDIPSNYEVIEEAAQIYKLIGRLRRLAERQCDDPTYSEKDSHKVFRYQDQITSILQSTFELQQSAFSFSSDPRGHILTILRADGRGTFGL